MYRLDDRIALVTGATRGIGHAIALAFAAAGARVMVSSRKVDAVDATVAEIRRLGGNAAGFPANVGRPDEAAALVDQTLETLGGIDIVVNNAAVNPVYGPIVDTSLEAFDKIMSVNLRAPFDIARRALPSMRERGKGSVINMSSIGGIRPEENLGIYSVSKAAIISLTQVMAREWGPLGVRANAICPGLIKTDFSKALWSREDVTTRMVDALPIPRIGKPEDIAHTALFLASDASGYCTGGVFTVDGGYTV